MYAVAAAGSPSASPCPPSNIYIQPVKQTPKTGKALLLGGPDDRTWEDYLRGAVEDLDRELVLANVTTSEIPWRDYDLVILDAGAVGDLGRVIAHIRARNAEARIIIFSSSPSWEQAREALLAGAVDYAPKELRHSYILGVVKRGLSKRVRDAKKQD